MGVFQRLNFDTSSDSSDTIAEDKALAVNRSRWVPSLLTRLNCSDFSPATPAVNDQRVAYTEGTNKGSPTDMTMVELHGLAKFFPWPNGVKLRLPCADGGSLADYPGCIVVYEDIMKAGFRVPLHPFICDFLSDTKLCPAQLTPNAWRSILAFLLKFKELNLVPSYEAFEHMYTLKLQRSVFYSVIFLGINLISLPKCADSWDKKWFLVCASDEFHFNFPMYPGKCKVSNTKNRRMIESSVGAVIDIFKMLPQKAGKNVLDASQLEEAGLSLPHPVKEPNLMYAQYIIKRKRANARIVVGPSNKKARTCASLQAFTESKENPVVKEEEEEEEDPEEESEGRDDDDDDNLEEEEDPEEDDLEGESEETGSVDTLCRPEVLTALTQLPELLLAAQNSQRLKRQLSQSIREISELKRDKSECRRREMELIEELASKSEEIQLLRQEKKDVEEELREIQSVFMEVTQKARECVEISSSALKLRVSSTRT